MWMAHIKPVSKHLRTDGVGAVFLLSAILLLLAQVPQAAANSISADETPNSTSPITIQITRSDRTLFISGSQDPLPVLADEGVVSVGRAGQLLGRPLSAIRKVVSPIRSASRPGALNSILQTGTARLTSSFGLRRDPLLGGWRNHSGVDLAASYGTPVLASGNGIVSRAGWQGGYGLLVSVDHGNGMQTRYGHLARLNVIEGQRVNKGDLVGFVGSTGRSTGPHLHYEVRENGYAVDPLSISLKQN